MGVEVAADVGDRDQLRQLPLAGRLQLTPPLAQLGDDVGVAEALVDGLLGLAEVDLPGLGVGDPVLGDREPARDRLFAQLDVVGGGAGEVLEQVAERLRGDDPQVDRDPVVGLGPHPVRPRRPGGGDQRVGREVLGQRRRLGRGRDQVDVLAGLGPAAGRAPDLDPVGRRVIAKRRHQLFGDRADRGEQKPARALAGLAEALHRREHVFLDLRPEPADVADPLVLGRLLQLLQGRDPELVVEAAGGFRPRPGTRVTAIRVGGNFAFNFTAAGISPVSIRASIFSARVLPTPRDLGRPALGGEVGDRDRAFADRLGRGAVGEDPVFDRAVELVEDAELLERGGDLGIGHTPSRYGPPPGTARGVAILFEVLTLGLGKSPIPGDRSQ